LREFKVTLALGGGGVRGFSHIGVLKVLELNQIPIDFIVGTSMGALVGAVYCLYRDINFLEDKAKEIVNSEGIKQLESLSAESETEEKKLLIKKFLDFLKDISFWYKMITKKWMIDSKVIKDLVSQIIPEDKKFSDLKIPFICVATDLLTGEEVILKEGSLLEAVISSSSIPGVFEPTRIENRLLIDGGISSLVPSLTARKLGGDFIIGVNTEGFRLKDDFKGMMDILFQADQITAHHLNKRNLSECDFVIQPEVSHLSWADFSKAEYCIEKGRTQTERILPQLKKTIYRKKFKTSLKRLFRRQ